MTEISFFESDLAFFLSYSTAAITTYDPFLDFTSLQ